MSDLRVPAAASGVRAPAPRVRVPLHRTVLRLAGAAAASAVLVWSGLFYSALGRHAQALSTASAPSGGSSPATAQQAPSPAPVVTRSS